MGLHPLQNKKVDFMKQQTMDNIYDGPSTLVRTATQSNVYPNINQQQAVNPHYGQQQPPPSFGSQMQKQGSMYAQQTLVQQTAYNPNYNNNGNGPSAPQI